MSLTSEEWNGLVPIGTEVLFWPADRTGVGREAQTRSVAWDLCGTPVVMVTGYSGGIVPMIAEAIALSHVDVVYKRFRRPDLKEAPPQVIPYFNPEAMRSHNEIVGYREKTRVLLMDRPTDADWLAWRGELHALDWVLGEKVE